MVRAKGASGRRELFDCPEKNVAKRLSLDMMPFVKNTLHLDGPVRQMSSEAGLL